MWQMGHYFSYSPHSVDFMFSTLAQRTNFILRGQSRGTASDRARWSSAMPSSMQGGSRGVTLCRLSYGCIYKTHPFPIMLVTSLNFNVCLLHDYYASLHVFLSTSHLRTLYIENHGPAKLITYMYIMASTVKCTLESTVIWLICHFVAWFVLK